MTNENRDDLLVRIDERVGHMGKAIEDLKTHQEKIVEQTATLPLQVLQHDKRLDDHGNKINWLKTKVTAIAGSLALAARFIPEWIGGSQHG